MTAELIAFAPSPFSWRARWALDTAGVPYSATDYLFSPFYLPTLPLRLRVGRLRGRLTAPILRVPRGGGGGGGDGGAVLMDSTQIARWADARGGAPGRLFPAGLEADVERWVAAADELSSLFRRELSDAAAGDASVRAALSRTVPVPAPLRPVAGALVGVGVAMMRRKYQGDDAAATEEGVRAHLRAAREQLGPPGAPGGPPPLLLPGGLSFADIALAAAVNKAAEVAATPLPLPAGGGKGGDGGGAPRTLASTMPGLRALLSEFPDVVAWAAAAKETHWPGAPPEVWPRSGGAKAA